MRVALVGAGLALSATAALAGGAEARGVQASVRQRRRGAESVRAIASSVPQAHCDNLHGCCTGCVYFRLVSELGPAQTPNGSRLRLALFCLFATCLQIAPAPLRAEARKPFSEEERKRLANGELVVRKVEERRATARLIGGSSWQVVKAPPDSVFRALLDTRHYDRSLPTVSGAELVSEHDDFRRVVIEHKKGPLGIRYRMALRVDRGRRDIGFRLNDPLDSGLRAAWGFLTVHPHGSGQSLLAYGVMADPGDGLIVGLARGVIHEWLMRVPEQVRKFVESAPGRVLYGSGPSALSSSRSGRELDGRKLEQRAP